MGKAEGELMDDLDWCGIEYVIKYATKELLDAEGETGEEESDEEVSFFSLVSFSFSSIYSLSD